MMLKSRENYTFQPVSNEKKADIMEKTSAYLPPVYKNIDNKKTVFEILVFILEYFQISFFLLYFSFLVQVFAEISALFLLFTG